MKRNKIILITVVASALIILITGVICFHNRHREYNYNTKEGIMLLLEKGTKSSSKAKIFMLSRKSLEDEYFRLFNEGKYKDLIGAVNFTKYNGSEYNFVLIKETDDSVFGYFIEDDNLINGTTYICIDKKSGKLKSLQNNLLNID